MTHNTVNAEFPPPRHNHARCMQAAVEAARDAFKRQGLSLTPLREKIFRAIAGSHRAIGAYALRENLKARGRNVQVMSIYRTIEVLMQAGVVRRLKSRNAFYASVCGSNPRSPRVVFACQECGCVGDADGQTVFGAIGRAAASSGFAPGNAVIEVLGTCSHCAKTSR